MLLPLSVNSELTSTATPPLLSTHALRPILANPHSLPKTTLNTYEGRFLACLYDHAHLCVLYKRNISMNIGTICLLSAKQLY